MREKYMNKSTIKSNQRMINY